MANETLVTLGAWGTVQASSSVADGALFTGANTTIVAALTTGSEDQYPLLDFKVSMTVGTPAADGYVAIYRRPSDGTDHGNDPATDYLHQFVGTVVFDNAAATTYGYLYGVANGDTSDEYFMINELGATCTCELEARGRTFNPA